VWKHVKKALLEKVGTLSFEERIAGLDIHIGTLQEAGFRPPELVVAAGALRVIQLHMFLQPLDMWNLGKTLPFFSSIKALMVVENALWTISDRKESDLLAVYNLNKDLSLKENSFCKRESIAGLSSINFPLTRSRIAILGHHDGFITLCFKLSTGFVVRQQGLSSDPILRVLPLFDDSFLSVSAQGLVSLWFVNIR
jgi:hypothetical protein